jgi:hypothetical protein
LPQAAPAWPTSRKTSPPARTGWKKTHPLQNKQRVPHSRKKPVRSCEDRLCCLGESKACHPLPGARLRFRLRFIFTLRLRLGGCSGLVSAGLFVFFGWAFGLRHCNNLQCPFERFHDKVCSA